MVPTRTHPGLQDGPSCRRSEVAESQSGRDSTIVVDSAVCCGCYGYGMGHAYGKRGDLGVRIWHQSEFSQYTNTSFSYRPHHRPSCTRRSLSEPSSNLVPAVSSDTCVAARLLHTLISPIAIVDARTRVNNNDSSEPMALIPFQTLVFIYARLYASFLR